jgi:hypothetical protein
MVGGALATAGTVMAVSRLVPRGPQANLWPAVALGTMSGLAGFGLSQMCGGSLVADAGAVAAMAGMGGVMMMGRGSAGLGAAIMGAGALGGVIANHLAS